MAEREIRYFEGQDYATRKQKGAIDLTRATTVSQKEINGQAGLTIDTPGRVWELLPEGLEAAVDWFKMLQKLLERKKGLAVVASMSNALDEVVAVEGDMAAPGELNVRLTRKLGMSINKVGNEIVVAELEPDGAAAACGLLSPGDALDEVNGTKTESCKQSIKLLMSNPSAAQLKIFSKVVHGGWMHKLGASRPRVVYPRLHDMPGMAFLTRSAHLCSGEGLGGWTTRYFTLTYELDPSALPRPAGAANTSKVADMLDAKRERPRAASVAAGAGSSHILVHLHKANRADKLGLSLAEDSEGRVVLQRIYDGYVAANNGSLLVGDVLVSVNGNAVANQPTAHKYLSEANGALELQVWRGRTLSRGAQAHSSPYLVAVSRSTVSRKVAAGCFATTMGRTPPPASRKGSSSSPKALCARSTSTPCKRKPWYACALNQLHTSHRRMIEFAWCCWLQGASEVPRVGMYILQDERCWELLPPEEELDMWIAKLQLAVFGQEVIALEYATAERATASAPKVRDLKGAHYLTLQQQYGLMLATYKDRDGDGATSTPQALSTFKDRPNSNVYIMSLEMDGGLTHPTESSTSC